MAYEVGGRADKYGNRFENNWTIYKLLDVLEEKIYSVTLEALGDNEKGIDLWLVDNDGIKDGQQCKARNKSEEYWSYGALNEKKIWQTWYKQLNRNEDIIVSLVSPLSFTLLEDITTRARNNSGSASEFYKEQILKSGGKIKKLFEDVCDTVGVNPHDEEEIIKIYSYFRRIYYRQTPDSEMKNFCLDRIEILFNDSPEQIYSVLLNYILTENIYGKEITACELYGYLKTKGIYFKDLAKDNRILPRINILNEEYNKSIKLFSNVILEREDSKKSWEYIKQGKSIIIHGQAGSGKSGCTYNIVNYCIKEKIPYLAIKLDKRYPSHNTNAWGRELGFRTSISHCVDSIAKNRNAVLILDQLDALRWTQAHSSVAIDVCGELIRELKTINTGRKHGQKISLVFVCRTYDLENDFKIKSLFDNNENEWEKIKINLLTDEEIKMVIGAGFDELNVKTRKLLHVASNLFIWENLDENSKKTNIEGSYQLVNKWWEQISSRARDANLDNKLLIEVKDNIVGYCDKNGSLTLPKVIFAKFIDYINFLISNSLVIEINNLISFSHQSLLDYFLAEQMIIQYYEGKSVDEIIGDTDKQNPVRRYQFQIFLQQLYESSEVDFLSFGEHLLESNNIRYSFKYVFFDVLSQSDVLERDTLEFVVNLLDTEWKNSVIDAVIKGNSEYISLLVEKGILSKWIQEGDTKIVIKLFESLSNVTSNTLIDFLREFSLSADICEDWDRCFCIDIQEDTDEFFELRMDFYRKHPKTLERYIDLNSILAHDESRALRVLGLMLEFKDFNDYSNNSSVELVFDDELIIHDYMLVLDVLTPFLPETIESLLTSRWVNRYFKMKSIERLSVNFIKKANKKFAEENSDVFLEYYKLYFGKGNALYNEIILDAFQYLDSKYADYIIEYLQQDITKNCFEETSGNGNKLFYTKNIVRKFSKCCSDKVLRKFEGSVINYSPKDAKERLQSRIDYNHKLDEQVYWSFWGDFQYEILSSIDEERISKKCKDLLGVLERKYLGKKTIYCYTLSEGVCDVVSPIYDKKLTAKQWIRIITGSNIKTETKRRKVKGECLVINKSEKDFSGGFRQFVSDNPNEILNLILENNDHVKDCYVDSLFSEIAYSEKVKDVSCDKLELLIRKFGGTGSSYIAGCICDIVGKNAKENWSDFVKGYIVDIALNNKSLQLSELNWFGDKNKEDIPIEKLITYTLNCARGKAFYAISKLLWANQENYGVFKECITEAVNDDAPVINCSTLWALLPIYNIDKQFAVEKMMKLYDKNYKFIGFYDSRIIINNCYNDYKDVIKKLIAKASKSDDGKLKETASLLIVDLYMRYDAYDIWKVYQNSEVEVRLFILEMLVEYFCIKTYKDKSKEILLKIIVEDNNLVNNYIWAKVFKEETLSKEKDYDLIIKIMDLKVSARVLKSFSYYVMREGNIKAYSNVILKISQDVLEENVVYNYESRTIENEVILLIIGLYDSVCDSKLKEDIKIANECLRIWDKMYECNTNMARMLTEKMLE